MRAMNELSPRPAGFRMILGDRRSTALPARIRAAIGRQQDRAERLIGLVQLGVVVMFGVLYFLSPTTYPADVRFVPVPYALALYFCFTLIRVALSFRLRLPDWFLMLSILIDIGLLMTLIWSFHLQYVQPPSFYLKIPTLLYVFMFISLRTLRFEPRFVAAAGITAAAGWAILVAYAATYDEGGTMVTRDFVEYMTQNAILIGAEFDKIISILVVTGILVVAQVRARRLLVQAVAEGQAAADLSRFFDSSLATQIRSAETEIAAGEGQARDGAVMFIDIRGFSALSAHYEPTALIRLLAEYQARVVPVIQAHGGLIDKFLGDGVMVTFGIAADSATYAADALRAAEAVIVTVDRWNAERAAAGDRPIVVNAAVASGRVVFGAVGDATRLEYTVIGAAVNLAAKLEKHAKAEAVRALATAEAYDIAVAQGFAPAGPIERRPQRRVQGIDQPIDLVALVP
ncbi:MAG: adenylate/guanylate cyclase domain-containing protein [Alphaproteobacteria bacterium]